MISSGKQHKLQLRLMHKGLIFVSVLLAIELGLFGSLIGLLHQAEEKAASEARAKAIIGKTNNLIHSFYDVASAAGNLAPSNSESAKRYRQTIDALNGTFAWLKEELKNDKNQLSILSRVEERTNDALSIIETGKKALAAMPASAAMPLMMHIQSKLQTVSDSLVPDLHDLIAAQEKIAAASPYDEQKSRQLAMNLLYLGIVMNVALAVILAASFVRGITSRLSILSDNSRRLAANQALHQRLEGSDEIAQLDHIFHDMSEALSEAKARENSVLQLRKHFVAMVTHELRTPLTSVKAYLTLLGLGALGKLTAQAEEGLIIAERNVSHLVSLINDLLDLEKMETGSLPINFSKVEIVKVIKSATDSVLGLANQQNIELKVSTLDACILGDEKRLVQVMINLLSNAIRFSSKDSKISVETLSTDGWLEVQVKDSGPGIPYEYQEIIFEKFQQIPTSSNKQGSGTGLGLAICKTIIEQHGGTIGIESQPGVGSTFWFRIPRKPYADLT